VRGNQDIGALQWLRIVILLGALSAATGRADSGDQSIVLRVGDVDRHYVVHVPPGYDGRAPLPTDVIWAFFQKHARR